MIATVKFVYFTHSMT